MFAGNCRRLPLTELNLLVFITLICWGLWGIADKKALSYASPEDVMARLYLISGLWIPLTWLLLAWFVPSARLNGEVMFWTGLSCSCSVIALLSYLSAMSLTEASYVLGITAAYPLVMQILASLILKEQLLLPRFAGALVIVCGLFLISGSERKRSQDSGSRVETTDEKGKKASRILLYVVVATLTWGVSGLFDKKAVGCSTALVVFMAKRIWDVVIFFILLLFYCRLKKKIKMSWIYCALSGCAMGIGGFTYIAALSCASASYVITITGCYPLLMYLFALWLLKERFNKLRFAGIMLVVAGGFLVQLTASS